MNLRNVVVLVCISAISLSCGGGLTPEAKLNRMHFLKTRKKDYAGALNFAKEAYQDESGEARSRILMEGAATAFQLYVSSQQKSYLQEMFGLLNIVINENLQGTPDAYHMAAQAYDKVGNLDKAVGYAKKAAQVAPDTKNAGRYYHEVVNFHLARKDHEKTVKEAEYLISKYPDYPDIEKVKALKTASEMLLEEMWKGKE